jgi:predicted AAA+ superfamily ATPase
MNYRTRYAESPLKRLAGHFKIVLVTGARQIGKTTLLRHAHPDLRLLVFDPFQDLYGAKADPDLLLDNFPAPLILDEIQFAPEMLSALKRRVDRSDDKGQYFLTGSQDLAVLRSVGESLAGRVGILHLEGMTLEEMLGRGDRGAWLGRYLDDPESLVENFAGTLTELGSMARQLWRGSLPGLLDLADEAAADYLRSYVETYIERDVRTAGDIREMAVFGRFLGLAAALTAQEINSSQLGRELGVKPDTARRWTDLLAATFQWRELLPFHGNAIKRLSGKSKGLFCDTGLACFLQRVSSPEALLVNPLLGAMFETWTVNAVLRQCITLPVPPQAYHWRTSGGAEVDLVLEWDGKLYPIEVKCKTTVGKHDTRGLRAFRETYSSRQVMPGLIIYAGRECYRVDGSTIALPWNAEIRDYS